MKYQIPDTTGAQSLCEMFIVTIGESVDENEFSPLASYLLYWPECCGMESVLGDLIETLNEHLRNRHLDNLKWGYRRFDPSKDANAKTIAVSGMFAISTRIRPKKHTFVVDGKMYKVDAEKLEVFLKSLE